VAVKHFINSAEKTRAETTPTRNRKWKGFLQKEGWARTAGSIEGCNFPILIKFMFNLLWICCTTNPQQVTQVEFRLNTSSADRIGTRGTVVHKYGKVGIWQTLQRHYQI